MKHYNITVTGKVQGVFYRQSALEKARQLGIRGYVKNRSDGSVFIEAEGQEDMLRQFVEWCKQGPKFAVVDRVEVVESAWQGLHDFVIVR